MSLMRFLSAGRLDSEDLGHRLHAAVDQSDDGVWALVSQSVVGRFGGGSVALVEHATPDSWTLAQVHAAQRTWASLTVRARLRLISVTAITAVISHLLLSWSQSGLDAWRLILPGLGAMFGFVVLGLSFVVQSRLGSTE